MKEETKENTYGESLWTCKKIKSEWKFYYYFSSLSLFEWRDETFLDLLKTFLFPPVAFFSGPPFLGLLARWCSGCRTPVEEEWIEGVCEPSRCRLTGATDQTQDMHDQQPKTNCQVRQHPQPAAQPSAKEANAGWGQRGEAFRGTLPTCISLSGRSTGDEGWGGVLGELGTLGQFPRPGGCPPLEAEGTSRACRSQREESGRSCRVTPELENEVRTVSLTGWPRRCGCAQGFTLRNAGRERSPRCLAPAAPGEVRPRWSTTQFGTWALTWPARLSGTECCRPACSRRRPGTATQHQRKG